MKVTSVDKNEQQKLLDEIHRSGFNENYFLNAFMETLKINLNMTDLENELKIYEKCIEKLENKIAVPLNKNFETFVANLEKRKK